ncbi:hypothetical protein PHLGIDRAFT_464060 [Phlebiopsis gigantea 11061_1 CR5-6]|uniref:Uncharacterized protein n=1 Tax=Phlebiopsis gigantea (strain 11061_1 CR5-6) TaxID=745531 RepID=A0A0C3NMU2_PHLG1|nr:hypothetical protein PHLGIDRAFT_464060 [Phlebiopsis gigantea 11061_1 CR5-6]
MEASSQIALSIYDRPTLPSLHTLGLPKPVTSTTPMSHEYVGAKRTAIDERTGYRARHVSISSTTSSCTDSSGRSTSPCNSDTMKFSRSSASPPPIHVSAGSLSLARSTMEEANAFVLVPPQQDQYVENISTYSRSHASLSKSRRNQALLLVGPALKYLRHPSIRIARGARLHPYRIVSHPSRLQSTSTLPHRSTD